MKLSIQQKIAQEKMDAVIRRCWEDKAFKQELVANPIDTLKKVGVSLNLPSGTQFKVVDQSEPFIVHFNIPPKQNFDNLELTDKQLDAVAGGLFSPISFFLDYFID